MLKRVWPNRLHEYISQSVSNLSWDTLHLYFFFLPNHIHILIQGDKCTCYNVWLTSYREFRSGKLWVISSTGWHVYFVTTWFAHYPPLWHSEFRNLLPIQCSNKVQLSPSRCLTATYIVHFEVKFVLSTATDNPFYLC